MGCANFTKDISTLWREFSFTSAAAFLPVLAFKQHRNSDNKQRNKTYCKVAAKSSFFVCFAVGIKSYDAMWNTKNIWPWSSWVMKLLCVQSCVQDRHQIYNQHRLELPKKTQPIQVYEMRWAMCEDAERACLCPFKAACYHCWKVMDTGEAPDNWRKRSIATIFKKGCRDDV